MRPVLGSGRSHGRAPCRGMQAQQGERDPLHINRPASALSTAIFGMFAVLLVKAAVLAFALVAYYALDGQVHALVFAPVAFVTSAMALYTLRVTATGLRSVL